MPAAYYKLNNPAWYALSEKHQHFAVGNEAIKRYPDTIAPFAACMLNNPVEWTKAFQLKPLTEPYVKVSLHTALVIQSTFNSFLPVNK